jgi:hypothetical protein
MVLNFATGGMFTAPQFDANGDGHINASDMVTVGGVTVSPVGVSLGNVYASGATMRSGALGTGGAGIAIVTTTVLGVGGTTSGGTVAIGGTDFNSTAVGGRPKSRTAWWEIRQ